MQNELLAKYPSKELRVYAVWLPILWGDAREKWNGNTLPDLRVTHFWDGEMQAGEWFAKEVEGYRGISWDTYYLYGPDAKWNAIPSPLVGSGGTIIAQREAIMAQIKALLIK
ncbi:MAG TPA: hypothetical protein VJM08_09175 [Anaerolineales bacterium]|nr:hypothetical protein [Anaerolineales bacterium]